MCIVSNVGTFFDKWVPDPKPFAPYTPSIPGDGATPFIPFAPIDLQRQLDQARELLQIMRELVEMQEKLGCQCDPAHVRNKPDYVRLLEARILLLEQALAEEMLKNEPEQPSTKDEF